MINWFVKWLGKKLLKTLVSMFYYKRRGKKKFSKKIFFLYSKKIMKKRKKEWFARDTITFFDITWWTKVNPFFKRQDMPEWRMRKTTYKTDWWFFKKRDYTVIKKLKLWWLVKKHFTWKELVLRWTLKRRLRGDFYFLKNYKKVKLHNYSFFEVYNWCKDTVWAIPIDVEDVRMCVQYFIFFSKEGLIGLDFILYGFLADYASFLHLVDF